MKLGLGTAQFGLDYGISNRGGKVGAGEVAEIVERARAAGVRVLDTAMVYGDAERVLGETGVAGFDVVSKVPGTLPPSDVAEAVRNSLADLGLPRLYGLLAHDAAGLTGEEGPALWDEMSRLKGEGLVARIGVSAYDGEQVDDVLARFSPDIVQVPVNVFDQRLLADGHLASMKAAGIEVHARSPHLQGLLLMDPEEAPEYFDPWRERLREFRRTVDALGVTPARATLGFVAGLADVDVVVAGVTNVGELEQAVAAVSAPLDPSTFAGFALDSRAILDPSRWDVER